MDYYTKMAKFILITTDLATPEFIALFYKNIELKITSKFWAEVCTYSLIKRRLSTVFHLQTDG